MAWEGVDVSELVTIRSLMMNDGCSWNGALVHRVFLPDTADAI